jgi:hypothetical protein
MREQKALKWYDINKALFNRYQQFTQVPFHISQNFLVLYETHGFNIRQMHKSNIKTTQ